MAADEVKLPEGFVMDGPPEGFVLDTPEAAKPAKWKEIGDQSTTQKIAGAVAPYAPAVASLAGGAIAAPANIVAPGVAEVAGTGIGYLVGKQLEDRLNEYAGVKKPVGIKAGVEALKQVPEAATVAAGGPIFSKGLDLLGKGTGAVVKPLWGRLTGTGKGAIEGALESGSQLRGNIFKSQTEFDRAMRGQTTAQEVVDNAKDAMTVLKDQRSSAYTTELKNIAANKTALDTTPIKTGLQDLMDQYKVKVVPKFEMKPAGVLNAKGQPIMKQVQVGESIDTSRIAMGKAGRRDIDEIIKTVKNWGSKPEDTTPLGLDTLKRQLDDFYSDSSQARQFVASLRNKVKDTIVKNVPEYAKMTKGYEEATTMIKDMESGLMLRKQGMTGRVVADQTLRRLVSSMKDNFELRRDLVQALSAKTGKDIEAQVAGYAMRSPIPLGLAGTGPALIGEAAIAKLVSPAFWPVLAASSPRVAGEFLRMYGKAISEVPGGHAILGKLAAFEWGNSGSSK